MFKIILPAAILVSLTACGSSDHEQQGFDFNADSLISNVVNNVIVDGYTTLNGRAQLLELAVSDLQSNPTTSNLLLAQSAWKAAREPWEQGESHIFGPVDSLEIDPHLDSWPLNTNDLAAEVADAANGYTLENVLAANDEIQGFHAMEYLLFGDGINDNTKAIVDVTVNELTYLSALTQAFAKYTDDLATSWTVNHNLDDVNSAAYKTFLLLPGNDVYGSQLAVLEELVDGMAGIVDEVGNGKIADPFGASVNDADTSKVESQYSWNSLTDFSNNIRGVQNVYRGEFANNDDAQGVIDFVAAADLVLANRVDAEIVTAITAIDAIAGEQNLPFREAIKDAQARLRIQIAIDALFTLQTSLLDDVKPLLNRWNS